MTEDNKTMPEKQIKPLSFGDWLPPITGTANVNFPSITSEATGTAREKTCAEKILEERRKKLKETEEELKKAFQKMLPSSNLCFFFTGYFLGLLVSMAK